MIDPRTVPVHFSNLKRISDSPWHYLQSLQEHEDSAAMRLGRLTHAVILGTPFTVYDGARRGKAWEEFQDEHATEEIFTATEVEPAQRMAEAVKANPFAARLIAESQHEVPIEWKLGARDCAGRIDMLGSDWIADLKTTKYAKPGWFMREALKRNYHAQLAWYQDGIFLATHEERRRLFVVAVQSSEPYPPATVYEISQRAIDQGRKLARLWFERLLVSEQSNAWPCWQLTEQLDIPDEEGDGVGLLIGGEEVEVAA